MYMLDSFLDMGLKEDQEFPSEDHRRVASALAICNPAVTNLDRLTEIVQKVLEIPKDKIEGYTFTDALRDGIFYRV